MIIFNFQYTYYPDASSEDEAIAEAWEALNDELKTDGVDALDLTYTHYEEEE